MCETCGCGDPDNGFKIISSGDLDHQHEHDHHSGLTAHTHTHTHSDGHTHSHEHFHGPEHHHHDEEEHEDHSVRTREVIVEQDVLLRNNLLAERNRGYFEGRHVLALNLVSSPGSGKTLLLERTIKELSGKLTPFVIEGDQQTVNDARRIRDVGAPVVQINTGNGCHLDAEMVSAGIKELGLTDHAVLFIENVGNLVCPALFDLGETERVVIVSVTEGEDKPLKYPNMFHSSGLCIINKIDLLPYLDFKVEKLKEYARQVNDQLEFIELSAKTGEGTDRWISWLTGHAIQ